MSVRRRGNLKIDLPEIKEEEKIQLNLMSNPLESSNDSILRMSESISSTIPKERTGRSEIKSREDELVEKMLEKFGYNVHSKILVKDNHGKIDAPYLEATSRYGHKVYIELDMDGYVVSVDPNYPVMVESKSASVIPYSSKIGAFECLGMDSCGVVFTCDNNICVITRSEDGTEPVETNFVFVERAMDSRMGKSGNSPMPYPIIRLSEIQANPEMVLKVIEDSTKQIRAALNSNCQQSLEKTELSLKEVNNAFARFDEVYSDTMIKLNDSISELDELNRYYNENHSLIESNQESYNKLLFNLRKRQEYVNELLQLCLAVSSTSEDLNRIVSKVDSISNHIMDRMKNLDDVLEQ